MKTILLAVTFLSLSLFSGVVYAASEGGEAVESTAVGNTICPVSGEKIGSMGEGIKVEYQGKSYNLCCEMCAKDFNENPGKYAAIAEAEDEGAGTEQDSGMNKNQEGHGGHDHHDHH